MKIPRPRRALDDQPARPGFHPVRRCYGCDRLYLAWWSDAVMAIHRRGQRHTVEKPVHGHPACIERLDEECLNLSKELFA